MAIIQNIEPTECIGNSLAKLNYNFKSLNTSLEIVDGFRVTANNMAPVPADGALLLSLNGKLTAARLGVDYIRGTAELGTGLIKTTDGTLSKAVSSVDYYVPGTILQAGDTTVTGTLNATGATTLGATTVNGNLNASGRAIVGVAGGLIVNNTHCVVNGDLQSTSRMYSQAFNQTSDIRLKTKIETIEYPLQKLEQLRGVTFEWIKNNVSDIGVIAQEVEAVLPEAIECIWDEEDKKYTKYVSYNKIIPLLIESVKALKAEVDYLRSRVDQS